MNLDFLINPLDSALRTLFAPAQSERPVPGDTLPEAQLSDDEKKLAAALMRVNHCGEICAQALYQGQGLTARNSEVRHDLTQAAREETEHLAWTEQRIRELGGRKSVLNPLWYGGSFLIGAVAGALGDRWNLGFLAETERQVEQHLKGHLGRLPAQDLRSRAIVDQMKRDEMRHAVTAVAHGGSDLPLPVRAVMKLTAKVMTTTAHRI
ncbi:MAG: 2-polyprenyl-3-methyl-6-methoxy-1,4-benzoquinone monooxygenase [Burkholderiales bacterium]|nr:2-polyprenyl-3-methyl-6-methoxy-1,4-benzoquinone monooxygenase [Burkholderiales bacterium]